MKIENLMNAQDYIFKALSNQGAYLDNLEKAKYYLNLEISWCKRVDKRAKVLSGLRGEKNDIHG